ncbi:pyruvate/2-oxoglutarate dehydrogenase complex dihydrolipoamide dehydrogenase (E3) component [Aeromicrobium panaciterrae]|uniref:Pyruvate/2-oxoglutarate dehydrogenase complex dihydrolipoamide dehydrogenase (E3) component n=1 Tax=Aeromicrobium panaciterrae TaxID=363861 RepID=A0ABU1ULK3_9ACTN|nr:NAD(P)/FAD-dependent oxidoreductase [Aeromicrobium panaciterrae]MDR7086040.1 pyruvate/2-oxoglutarate dehydrogenase complex dihydrolipoamide dehydrogenase (E3) component [Aeromicrobium panaciterrae]
MASHECDVVVVGLGPGGEAVVARLAGAGLKVVAVEAELVGGECPYWGCIPSKMFIRAANTLAEARRVEKLAGGVSVTPDFAMVAKRIRDEATDNWDDTVAAKRVTDAGATLVRGHGRLVADRTVEVDGETYVASKGVVLNTGTTAAVPPIAGLADTPFWTNREAVSAESLPASLIVIGGGAIGLELAQAFSRFDSQVTVLEGAPRILAPEEPESSELLAKVFEAEGIAVHAGITIDRVDHDGTRFTVTCGEKTYEADQLLVAAGRKSRLDDVGLDTVGVEVERFLTVDDSMQVTSYTGSGGLWAIGDIVGRGAFTHVSMYHAERVVKAILGEELGSYDTSFPRVTFTDPEVGGVGLTEKQARDQGIHVRVGSGDIAASSRGWLHSVGNEGLLKLIIDDDRGVIVGATSAGPTGGETLSALAFAVRAEIPVETLKNTIYAYPTFYRAIESAL